MHPTPDPFRGSCRPTTAVQAENMRKFAVTVVNDAGGTCAYDAAVTAFARKLQKISPHSFNERVISISTFIA